MVMSMLICAFTRARIRLISFSVRIVRFTKVSGSIGAVQAESDDDHDNGDEAGNQKRDICIPQYAPSAMLVV
jgi:hypothetical protein